MIMEKIEKMNNFMLKNLLIGVILMVLLYIFMNIGGSTDPMPIEPRQYDSKNVMLADYAAPEGMMMRSKSFTSANSNNSKIIKEFTLSIESKDVNNVKNKVETEIVKNNAIIDAFYSYTYFGNELAYNFVINIPTDKFSDVINNFKKLGITKSESSSSLDVAEQYQDNANRLTNLYARRERLRKMMTSKTEKLADIIAVDRELNNVQNEIENLENANKKIDNNVSYSKLNLSIIPETKIENLNNSQWQIGTSWKQAVNDFTIFTQKTIDFVFKIITFVPVILIVLILFILIKVIIIRKKVK